MSEGIVLSAVPRHTLSDEATRLARLDAATPQILAAVAGECDAIVLQATLAALVWEAMPHASWVGFYRRVGPEALSIGPYQGAMGCLHISFTRGVCGACARSGKVQIVPDVSKIVDHIACDSATNSELVVPVFAKGRLQAVLDIDSHHLAAFSATEGERLTGLLASAFSDSVVWPAWTVS